MPPSNGHPFRPFLLALRIGSPSGRCARRWIGPLLLAGGLFWAPAAGTVAAQAPQTLTFRTWISGQEAGGAERTSVLTPDGPRETSHEWLRLERLGASITEDVVESVLKRPDGSLHFTFSLTMAQEPVEGHATWTPAAPGKLTVVFKGLPQREVDLPPETVLWPGDEESLLRAGARARAPIHVAGYSVSTLQPVRRDLEPAGPDPLPGFPGAVRYKGRTQEGPMISDEEAWISPEEGEVKTVSSMGGIPLLVQRKELPAPAAQGAPGPGLFDRTVKSLPPHPFLPWLDEVTVRWQGKGSPEAPEDPFQRPLGQDRYRLLRPRTPSAEARRQPPVQGPPRAEDAPYLAETPLVKFRDPVFDGLMKRLAAPAGASRWDLALRVNAFVFDWIREVDYTVGFASAQEVARNPRGDCTEHGVLEVALLRRLGVPSRGVMGWVAMNDTMGLHFWVEARIGDAWVPLDPTFDQAPASAFRIKLGTTDLADPGAVGWDNAAAAFQEGAWIPEAPWADSVRVQGDTVYAPDRALRVPGARWTLSSGILRLDGRHRAYATCRPLPSEQVRLLQGARGRKGWFGSGNLWVDCGGGDWLLVEGLGESEAFRLLDVLEIRAEGGRKAA